MDGWTDGWIHSKWTEGYTVVGRMDRWIGEWMSWWMGGRMDGWVDTQQVDGWIHSSWTDG